MRLLIGEFCAGKELLYSICTQYTSHSTYDQINHDQVDQDLADIDHVDTDQWFYKLLIIDVFSFILILNLKVSMNTNPTKSLTIIFNIIYRSDGGVLYLSY